MLKIFNNLEPFFKDCYRRINIREYARMKKISPPSASKLLFSLEKEGLLLRQEERRFMFFYANRESKLFVSLSQAYWGEKLRKAGLPACLQDLVSPTIVVFGSFAKAEVKPGSDIDIAVFDPSGRKPNLDSLGKKLGMEMHVFAFKKIEDVESPELKNNIMNGFLVMGNW